MLDMRRAETQTDNTLGSRWGSTMYNQRFLIDIMHIESKPSLHIVDESTNFISAKFLKSVSAESVWSAFINAWSLTYSGNPSSLLVGQGSVFLPDVWQ